jgi:hypothetical protein
MRIPTAPTLANPDEDVRLKRFEFLCKQYEICSKYCLKLRQLESFEIIFLCDDSGSMSTILDDDSKDPFGKKKSRWDELCSIVSIVSEISAVLDPNGIDIYFLNRPAVRNIYSSIQVQEIFKCPPNGFTPILNALEYILSEKVAVLAEKKVLLILVTDGQPTTPQGEPNISEFKKWLKNKPKNLFLEIVACTDDVETMKYLDKIDNSIDNLDVVDDFISERKQIKKMRGKDFSFTFGDYIAKILLGSIDPELDELDESDKKCIIQ